MSGVGFVAANTIGEALKLLAELQPARLLAGGTDLVVQMREGHMQTRTLVDLSRVSALRGIVLQDGVLRIGSMTTFAQLMRDPLVAAQATALAIASAQVGSVQIRNQGTLGGNLANASPAGDSMPPLFVLEANVSIASVRGTRQIKIADLVQGVGKNTLAPDELITEVSFLLPNAGTRSAFVKLGRRKAMAIARISMAGLVKINDEGLIEEARLALGAVGATVFRATQAEEVLRNRRLSSRVVSDCSKALTEIVAQKLGSRASAVYKREAIRGVAAELFFQLYPQIMS